MPPYRSRTTTHGRNMAGARGLWRATGMKNEDFGKPIIAVVNSFTQFVPGHVHLKDLGQLVASEIRKAGANAKEFNTIAVDDGIAMGHDGIAGRRHPGHLSSRAKGRPRPGHVPAAYCFVRGAPASASCRPSRVVTPSR